MHGRIGPNVQLPMFKIYFADEKREMSFHLLVCFLPMLINPCAFTLLKNVPSHAVRCKYVQKSTAEFYGGSGRNKMGSSLQEFKGKAENRYN